MRGLRIVFICELWETLRARSCESSLISDKLDILDNGFFERSVTGTSITEMVKKRELQDNNVTLYQLVGKIIFLRLFLSASYSCSRFYIFIIIILFFFQNGTGFFFVLFFILSPLEFPNIALLFTQLINFGHLFCFRNRRFP